MCFILTDPFQVLGFLYHYKQGHYILTHQSGVHPIFLQHFLSEMLTEPGKILYDFGGGAKPLWVSFFLVTRNKFLYIVADVGVGRHLVQKALDAPFMDTFSAWWANVMS